LSNTVSAHKERGNRFMNAQKLCTHCRRAVEAGVRFCPYCGQAAFQELPIVPTPQLPATTQIATPGGIVQLPYYQQLPPVPQKKSKNWVAFLIVGIALVIGVVIGVAVNLLPALFSMDSEGYTKGVYENGVYYNEWAGLSVTLPEGYSNGTEEDYLYYEGDNVDCGVCFYDEMTGNELRLIFEQMTFLFDVTENEYLDSCAKQWEADSDADFTITADDTYGEITLGGEVYKLCHCEIRSEYGSYYTTAYVRRIDNHMLLFMSISDTAEGCDALIADAVDAYVATTTES